MYFVCIERTAYWLLWISLTVYALYQFAQACQSDNNLYRLQASNDLLREGNLNENLYDQADFEWQSFKKLHVNYWYLLLIHFAVSNIFTSFDKPQLKLASWILVTLYATYSVFSLTALIVVVINVIILILLAILGKNILSYALCFGVILASQSTQIANRLFNADDPRMTTEFDFEEKQHLFIYCLCFLNARGLSSSIDNLNALQKRELQSSKTQFFDKVVTITAYLLYLPGFFAGPIYLYGDFEKASRLVRAEPEKEAFMGRNYFKSMTELFILIANTLYYEWLLHWLYSSAISFDHNAVKDLNSWQISGYLVSICLLFYMKYSCIYGTFKVLSTFDGLTGVAPPLPQCVAAMHLNSQLWRKFDVGIYLWLRRYIYDPIVRTGRRSIVKKFLATVTCFTFVTLWHLPMTPALITWISLNIVNSFIEMWAKTLASTNPWMSIRNKLSRACYLRLLAVLGLPLFILSLTSNLFFLSGNEKIGHEFIRRLIMNVDNYSLYFLIALYCGANVSLDYNKVVKSSCDFAEMHGFVK